MRFDHLIYGLVVLALGGAAFRFHSHEPAVTPKAPSPVGEIRSENDHWPHPERLGHVARSGKDDPKPFSDDDFVPGPACPYIVEISC